MSCGGGSIEQRPSCGLAHRALAWYRRGLRWRIRVMRKFSALENLKILEESSYEKETWENTRMQKTEYKPQHNIIEDSTAKRYGMKYKSRFIGEYLETAHWDNNETLPERPSEQTIRETVDLNCATITYKELTEPFPI